MSNKSRRSTSSGRKKGPDRNETAIKHPKEPGGHLHDTDHDVHEDRGIRKQKLGKHPAPRPAPRGQRSF